MSGVRVRDPPRAHVELVVCDPEIPPPRLPDLRHTHATLALKAGVHPKVVSERLGHATVGFTLDLYSHVVPSLAREAAEQIMSSTYGEDFSGSR